MSDLEKKVRAFKRALKTGKMKKWIYSYEVKSCKN